MYSFWAFIESPFLHHECNDIRGAYCGVEALAKQGTNNVNTPVAKTATLAFKFSLFLFGRLVRGLDTR
jgi:hypothetical protein